MNVDAADGDDGQIGGESLDIDFARAAAVERVTDVRSELFQIDMVDAMADFFVAGKENANGAVQELRMLDEMMSELHDDGDAGLVVGAEQRGAIGGDDRFADEALQLRVVGDPNRFGRVAREWDVAAAIA